MLLTQQIDLLKCQAWLSCSSLAEKPVFVRGRVPESLRVRFKATCALEGRDMSDVLKELIQKWLEENEKPSFTKKGKGN